MRLTAFLTIVACLNIIGHSTPWFTVHANSQVTQTPQDQLVLPRRLLTPAITVVKKLGKAGWIEEGYELIAILRTAGLPDSDLQKLKVQFRKARAKKKLPPKKMKAIARSLKIVVKKWEKHFKDLDFAQSSKLAKLIVALDDNCESAQKTLDRKLVAGQWLSFEQDRCEQNRYGIEDAAGRARRLKIPLVVSQSKHPILMAATDGMGGTLIRFRNVEFHCARNKVRATRVIQETLRTLAFSEYLLTGKLEVPELPASKWVALATQAQYRKSVTFAKTNDLLDETGLESADRLSGFFTKDYLGVNVNQTEAEAESVFAEYLRNDVRKREFKNYQANLQAGHMNFVCLTMLGEGKAHISYNEAIDREQKAYANENEKLEREYKMRLARAGMAGCRSWLAWLAQRDEDPKLAKTMLKEVGEIQGDLLLKATVFAEFLQEMGWLQDILTATAPESPENSTKSAKEVFEKAFKCSLIELEGQWKRWLIGAPRGLLQRLEIVEKKATDPGTTAVLRELNLIREAAFRELEFASYEVLAEEELSRGARLHAEYLGFNPEQVKAWPDAHEEYPDKKGFDPLGARAGARSVIAPGVKSAKEALDGWMGTFYHRLPLLDSGLLAIGWGLKNNVAVLDSGSMVTEWGGSAHVRWPYKGMRRVPLRFNPELPNPVPGEDQSKWGYPITLQLSYEASVQAATVVMELMKGDLKGPVVDCFYATPEEPTNIECAPAGAYCLIPKATLAANTTYYVRATITGKQEQIIEWWFLTAK